MANDSQRNKCYAWEAKTVPQVNSREEKDQLTEEQFWYLLRVCLQRFGLTPEKREINLVRHKVKGPSFTAIDRTFRFPSKKLNPTVAVHEIAHYIAWWLGWSVPQKSRKDWDRATVPHGPLFMTVYLDLLIHVLGYDAVCLLESQHEVRMHRMPHGWLSEHTSRKPVPVLGIYPSNYDSSLPVVGPE